MLERREGAWPLPPLALPLAPCFFKEPLAAPCCVKWVSAEPAFLKKKINKRDGFYFCWKRTSVVLFYMGRSSLFVDEGSSLCAVISYRTFEFF